jgi:hypothetical protein
VGHSTPHLLTPRTGYFRAGGAVKQGADGWKIRNGCSDHFLPESGALSGMVPPG